MLEGFNHQRKKLGDDFAHPADRRCCWQLQTEPSQDVLQASLPSQGRSVEAKPSQPLYALPNVPNKYSFAEIKPLTSPSKAGNEAWPAPAFNSAADSKPSASASINLNARFVASTEEAK
mmetsp:Transcript_60389/g.153484  ORF Transcript_60389/g.153484 Transcript_60389/m.153484 type:complete len:119 (+) Transcript_60389:149-505(+)